MKCIYISLTLFSIYTHFNTLMKKCFRKILWKKVKLLILSSFTFFHNVFYAICILKSFNSHISVVAHCFFRTVSKWCLREWVKMNPFFVTGRGGSKIRELQDESGCRIFVSKINNSEILSLVV